jgi:hypothetical protein
MIKTKLGINDVMTLLKMIDYCLVSVESQYQARQYSQKNYNNFHILLYHLSRVQKWRDTYFVRYLSLKEKDVIEKCLQIGQQAAQEACKDKRIAPTVLEDIIRLYKRLQEF